MDIALGGDKGENKAGENKRLLAEIRDVKRKLDHTEEWFSLESNNDLIDACIFEREALCARYRYLLGLARQQGLSASPFAEDQ